MDDLLQQALEIVKAQAGHRTMTEDEIVSMVASLMQSLKSLDPEAAVLEEKKASPVLLDPKKSVKEKSITCLECGKVFKVLTRKHLLTHKLTPEAYREKYGMKKRAPLACKFLQRERRKKMKDMKLWEKRQKKDG